MNKKVSFGVRPSVTRTSTLDAEAWVSERSTDEREPMKRLTIDIPAHLHRAIKTQCASRGTKIADELRELLLEKYGKS